MISKIIDFHSHVLPGMDDGSASVEESIEMLRRAAAQGIQTVVATPHFYAQHHTPERFLAKRDEAERVLREAMAEQQGLPKLLVGAEVYYFSGISDSDIIERLTIGGKGSILLEMAYAPWTDRMYRELEEIRGKHNIIPIIAHVDRYISPFRTHRIPQRLERLPVLVQANASFFLNVYTRNMALRLLREDRIHLLGSDCHNLTDRSPNLGGAIDVIRKRLGQEPLERIDLYQQALLND